MTLRLRGLVALFALLAAAAPRSLAAQAATGAPRVDTMRLARMLPRTGRASVATTCLTLRVTPGDTTGRAMPRASGDTLAGTRMPRATSAAPSCDAERAAHDAIAWRPVPKASP
jgi:hypothetical protein